MYVIEKNALLQKTYFLMCLFFANKEIARRSDPTDPSAPLSGLERYFFTAEASRLLIEVAVAIRIIDDQMRRLPFDAPERERYFELKGEVDTYPYGLFDDLELDLRKTCNKIIHSEVMEPHSSPGTEPHELDIEHRHFGRGKSIDWTAFNGYVRLCGTEHGKAWYVLLDIEVFVGAVFRLFSDQQK